MRKRQRKVADITVPRKSLVRGIALVLVLAVVGLGAAGFLSDAWTASLISPVRVSAQTPPRLTVTPDFIIPQKTASAEHVVKVVLGGNVGFPVTNGNVAISLPSYMTYVSGAASGTSVVSGGGQSATASLQCPNNLQCLVSNLWAIDIRVRIESVADLPSTAPSGAVAVFGNLGWDGTVNFPVNINQSHTLVYTNPRFTRVGDGPVGPGQEITFRVDIHSLQTRPLSRNELTVVAPPNTDFVENSFSGHGNGVITNTTRLGRPARLINWGTSGAIFSVTYRLKVRTDTPTSVETIDHNPGSTNYLPGYVYYFARVDGNPNQGVAEYPDNVTVPVDHTGVALNISIPDKRFKVDDQFAATIKVSLLGTAPRTVTFNDPVIKEQPFSGLPADKIFTVEPPEVPPPFELDTAHPQRTFTALVRVDKLGLTQLQSSLSYTGPGGLQGTKTTTKKVTAPPFDVTVLVTPRITELNRTAPEKKTDRCRQIETQTTSIKNCIEVTTTVKNSSQKTITNVNIPNATSPLRLINEADPRTLGEPLTPIEFIHPAGPGPVYPPIDLAPGQEATWTWRLNAFDGSALLEFEPTVFGVMDGQEVGAHGTKAFNIIKDPLLEWGMRPTDGRTSYKSGDLVRADGYIENMTAINGGEGKDLLVYVYAIPKGNAGGGWVVPMEDGEAATQEYFFTLPHEDGVRIKTVKSIFRSMRAGRATTANIKYGVRLWVINDDGSITDAGDQAKLNDEGYTDEFDVSYAPEQIVADTYLQDCLDQDVPPELCGFSEKFYSDFLGGIVGLGEFAVNGLDFLAEGTTRSMAIQAKRDQLKLQAVADDPEAKAALMQSLHADYLVLHQQGVLAGHVAGSLPMALQEFSNQTWDGFGRYMYAIERGDLEEIQIRNGQFFGSNPDLLLEPLMMLRGIIKLRSAVGTLRHGTADNVYAAAVQTSARKQAADLDARIAAKKAQGGDPDLAKALLPGDRLTEKLLIEVFGVDQDTVRRIQKIADDAGVVLAFRARSARASQLLRDGLAWAKPQALKQKCVNKLDIVYLGYDELSYGKIEIVEPPASLRGLEGEALETAVDAHVTRLLDHPQLGGELRGNKELRAEVRDRIKTRAEEWNKYTPKLELDNPDRLNVPVSVNFEAPMQWAHDRVLDIGPGETRKIYRNQRASRIDPATGEPVRTWEIKMDGPGGQEARHVTGDIDFLGILDQNGAFINDKDKRMAIYKALSEAQLMEHGESMSFRLEKARLEYLECCLLGSGEGMLTIGPWGQPRVGFFIDNRSVINDANAAFKRVRRTEVARKPSGEVIYVDGQPKTVVIRMEDPTGEFLLYNGTPMLNFIDESVERVFTPLLWKTVWEDYFNRKVKMFFPGLLKEFIEEETSQSSHKAASNATYSRGGPIVRFEPHAIVELTPHDKLQMWTIAAGWTDATREQVVAEGQPGVTDFAPYSTLRTNSKVGANKFTIASLDEMGATGDFFVPGDWVVLNPGGGNQEIARIASMDPLTLAAPLQQAHQVGEMVAWIEQPAAMATVAGFVRTPEGRGIASVEVAIIDSDGVSRVVKTNTFGRFRFNDIQTGQIYSLEARSRRYEFGSQKISVNGDLTDIEIVPLK